MAKKRFVSGPWRGSYRASEPFLNAPELARLMLNGYVPDPQNGAGFYSRPGVIDEAEVTSNSNTGQCVLGYTTPGGSAYNFIVADGKLYRWNTSFTTTITDVTPPNVQIDASAVQVYALGYGDGIVFNDGTNNPWYATDLGATPVTGTHIDYVDNTVWLSLGGIDTRVANAAGRFILNGTGYTILTADTALPAGTIPANQWGVYRVSVDDTDTKTVTAGAANYTTGYATEAAAIAAVPDVPTDEYDLGYFTVKTAVGLTFIAGTDALQGGISGNPASATNYYAGSPRSPWLAFGQPVIYAGSVFFVGKLVDTSDVNAGTGARTAIIWSEPNFPLVGYRQTGYDNVWELTQTSTEPIYALAGTNDGLYYFRAYSIGAVSGTPGVNFQGTATHDVVSANVGTVAPATVKQFLGFIYFADQFGRPWRLPIGGPPEAIWLQAREIYEDTAVLFNESTWAVIEPNLNLYICKFTGFRQVVFNARDGAFFGQWERGTNDLGAAGQVYNNTGQKCVLYLQSGDNASDPIELRRLALISEAVWTDDNGGMQFALQTHYQGYETDETVTPTHVVAIAELGNAQTPIAASGTVYTMNGSSSLPSFTPQSLASGVDGIGRYVWEVGSGRTGRGVRVQIAFSPSTQQVKLYRVATEVDVTGTSIYDR